MSEESFSGRSKRIITEYTLFNVICYDAVNISDYIATSGRRFVSNEAARMWKELSWFNVRCYAGKYLKELRKTKKILRPAYI